MTKPRALRRDRITHLEPCYRCKPAHWFVGFVQGGMRYVLAVCKTPPPPSDIGGGHMHCATFGNMEYALMSVTGLRQTTLGQWQKKQRRRRVRT